MCPVAEQQSEVCQHRGAGQPLELWIWVISSLFHVGHNFKGNLYLGGKCVETWKDCNKSFPYCCQEKIHRHPWSYKKSNPSCILLTEDQCSLSLWNGGPLLLSTQFQEEWKKSDIRGREHSLSQPDQSNQLWWSIGWQISQPDYPHFQIWVKWAISKIVIPQPLVQKVFY